MVLESRDAVHLTGLLVFACRAKARWRHIGCWREHSPLLPMRRFNLVRSRRNRATWPHQTNNDHCFSDSAR